MKDIFISIFMEEKYHKELSRWLTYSTVIASVLLFAGYLVDSGIADLISFSALVFFIVPSLITYISLRYGGKHILSIASLGGLSFGTIILYFGLNVFNITRLDISHFVLLAIILMVVFAVASSRRKFSEQDELIRAGMSMMVTFTIGAVVGIILALLFSFILHNVGINDRIGVRIGFFGGIGIMVVYLGSKLGDHFNLGEKEIYSPMGAAIMGTGIGGILSLGIAQIYLTYYEPFFYEILSLEISLALILLLIEGGLTGFFFAYLAQKIKSKVDKKAE